MSSVVTQLTKIEQDMFFNWQRKLLDLKSAQILFIPHTVQSHILWVTLYILHTVQSHILWGTLYILHTVQSYILWVTLYIIVLYGEMHSEPCATHLHILYWCNDHDYNWVILFCFKRLITLNLTVLGLKDHTLIQWGHIQLYKLVSRGWLGID